MPPLSKRCECCLVNSKRRCRGFVWSSINGRRICILHARYYYLTSIETIQNIYRNIKMRNAIKIYKNLPDDIQRKIRFYGRENQLIKQHHYVVIERILYNKVLEIEYTDRLTSIGKHGYVENCSQLFNLFKKYYEIISYDLHCNFAFVLHYCYAAIMFLLDQPDNKESLNKILIQYNKYFKFILEMDKNLFDEVYVKIVYY